jgi:hypothetical protein
LLTAVAAFAEAFVNPAVALLVLLAALGLPRAWQVRCLAAILGCGLGLLAWLGERASVLPLAMLGGALALLLHAEIALHLLAPALRWLARCVVTAWELLGLLRAMLARLWPRPRPEPPEPPGPDATG